MKKVHFGSLLLLALIMVGCGASGTSDGTNDDGQAQTSSLIQASILAAGVVETVEYEPVAVPEEWSEFVDIDKMGVSFRYPTAWGEAAYIPDSTVTGRITFANNDDYVVYVSSPYYEWEDTSVWAYPAFRIVECNAKRDDSVCEFIQIGDKVFGKDSRFAYLEQGGRGGAEQVAYFMNPNTGYRLALFTPEFGEYVEGELQEQLDFIQVFRTKGYDEASAEMIDTVNAILQSVVYY